jgi:aminoglycoside 3-N-acetyltransferase
LKGRYHRIKKSRLYGYFRSKYIKNSKKITERFFSYTPIQLDYKLKAMGISEGDTILMHSGFKFLNGFNGTPDQVIECILNIIGRSGNLLMVSMPYRGSTYEYLKKGIPFDVNNTMSAMGIITETFRRRPGVVRSLNPAHPILACGPAAEWIISDHEKTMYSCGQGSPFEKILQFNAKAFFFDVPPRLMTFSHYLEDLFKETLPVKLYEDTPLESIVIDVSGNKRVVKTYVFSYVARTCRDGRNLRRALIRDKVMKTEIIGRTKLAVVNLKQVVECAQKIISSGASL